MVGFQRAKLYTLVIFLLNHGLIYKIKNYEELANLLCITAHLIVS